jgi:hypothetical protein
MLRRNAACKNTFHLFGSRNKNLLVWCQPAAIDDHDDDDWVHHTVRMQETNAACYRAHLFGSRSKQQAPPAASKQPVMMMMTAFSTVQSVCMKRNARNAIMPPASLPEECSTDPVVLAC